MKFDCLEQQGIWINGRGTACRVTTKWRRTDGGINGADALL